MTLDFEKLKAFVLKKKATKQKLFDYVVMHCYRQGKQSADGGTCLYRGPNNTSCAVGCLLTDKEAEDNVNDAPAYNVCLPARLESHRSFLTDLQDCHDAPWTAKELEAKFKSVAVQYKLKFKQAEYGPLPKSWRPAVSR